MTRYLSDAQREHTRVIDGVTLAPWNWNTVDYCEGRTHCPADDLAACAQVFGMLMLVGEQAGAGSLLTTEDRRYVPLQRAFWAEFGVAIPLDLCKRYVPWWAGKWGNDKLGRKLVEV